MEDNTKANNAINFLTDKPTCNTARHMLARVTLVVTDDDAN